MKTFISIIAFSFCLQGLFAQYETIYPSVTGNQVCIHNDSAWRNCAFSPGLEYVTIHDSIINWYQIDTIGAPNMGCDCVYNFSITIDSLNSGNYYVQVFSCYNSALYSDTNYVGSTNFTIVEQTVCDSIVYLSSTRTNCLLTSLNNNSHIEQYILEQNSNGLLIVCQGQKKIIKVALSNLSGQMVFFHNYNPTSEILLSTCTFKKGLYIITLYDNQDSKENIRLTIF